jgi:hypothetical protein
MKRFIPFLIIAVTLFAQDPKIDLTIAERNYHIGDRIMLNYQISAGEKYAFVLPQAPEWFKDIDIFNSTISKSHKRKAQFITLNIEVVAFDTGFVHIPSMPIIKTDSTGFGKPDTLFTPEKYIYIYSMLDSAATPLSMNAPLPLALMTWWEFLVALLLLSAAVALLLIGLKYHSKKKTVSEEIWESPIEKAQHYLEELDRKQYPQKEQWKAFYLELTFIARAFFENIFYVHLQELTTTDLIPVFKEHMDDSRLKKLQEFFQYADIVKFAKGVADQQKCEQHFELIKEHIEERKEKLEKESID